MENVSLVSDSEERDLDDDTVNQKDSVTEPDPANIEFESKKISEKPVNFNIHTLPIISNMVKITRGVGNMFQFMQGYTSEN